MNKQQKEDFKTLIHVADVEFRITGNTVLINVPIKVPDVLKSALLRLKKQNPERLSLLMGQSLLKLMHEQLSVEDITEQKAK